MCCLPHCPLLNLLCFRRPPTALGRFANGRETLELPEFTAAMAGSFLYKHPKPAPGASRYVSHMGPAPPGRKKPGLPLGMLNWTRE